MRGTDDLEARLRREADGFPGVASTPGGLDAVVSRGRRGRTFARAGQLGVAASLVAGVALAAPSLLREGPLTPEVTSHLDEEAVRDTPPARVIVDVTSPWDGVLVDDPAVTFAGVAEIGARVSVEGIDVAVAPDGQWQITLTVEEGEHAVEFRGVARDGRVGWDTVTVTWRPPVALGAPEPSEEASTAPSPAPIEPAPTPSPVKSEQPAPAPKPAPKPEPKTTPKPEPQPQPATVAFTANQKYGSCEEQIPYDEFWGTAQPGTEVWVWSEYGQTTVKANGSGEWFAHLEFPEAPRGVAFDVKTKSLHTEEKVYWQFVNNGPGGADPATQWSAWQHNERVAYDPPYNYYEGTAAPGTKVFVASDHGSAETVADGSGHWKTKVWFDDAPHGTNTWTVVVESSQGDRSTFEFTGVRPAPAEQVAFTSQQVHASTDAATPTSRYRGTAAPESKVWIHSDHGEAYVYADLEGNWDVWVEFPSAPRNAALQVTVKHWDTGEQHHYELQVT